MNWVKDLIDYFTSLLKWWVIVLPWQEGIRIRLGKRETHLYKGIYLKLPIIDNIFVQNVRLRYTQIPIQTITTKDGKTITLSGAISFKITDVQKLYHSITNPEATITGIAMSKISDFVATHDLPECTPENLQNAVNINGSDYGLETEIKITSFAAVRTFRLIQDSSWMPTHKDYEI